MNRAKQLASVLVSNNSRGRSGVCLILAVLAVVLIVPIAARNSSAQCPGGTVNWTTYLGTNPCAQWKTCQDWSTAGRDCADGTPIVTAKVVALADQVNLCAYLTGGGNCTETIQQCGDTATYTAAMCVNECVSSYFYQGCIKSQ